MEFVKFREICYSENINNEWSGSINVIFRKHSDIFDAEYKTYNTCKQEESQEYCHDLDELERSEHNFLAIEGFNARGLFLLQRHAKSTLPLGGTLRGLKNVLSTAGTEAAA